MGQAGRRCRQGRHQLIAEQEDKVKAVSELYLPVGGEIVAINKSLEESPELLNKHPYGEGWIVDVKPSEPSELETLLSKEDYLEMLKGKR